jgi:hypothetical protein
MIDGLKLFLLLKYLLYDIYLICIFYSAIRQAIYIFLAKTSRFITIIVPLIDKTINYFRLIKPNSRPISADS